MATFWNIIITITFILCDMKFHSLDLKELYFIYDLYYIGYKKVVPFIYTPDSSLAINWSPKNSILNIFLLLSVNEIFLSSSFFVFRFLEFRINVALEYHELFFFTLLRSSEGIARNRSRIS